MRRIALVTLSTVIGLLALEAGARFLSSLGVPVQPQTVAPSPRTQNIRIPVPYAGFTHPQGLTVAEMLGPRATPTWLNLVSGVDAPSWLQYPANGLGFFEEEIPIPARGRVTVAIVGGSVAQWFALTATEALAEAMQIPSEELLVINLSQGSYKQPQQVQALLAAVLLEQELDAVVNIDGFNEAALSEQNLGRGFPSVYPAARIMLELSMLQSHPLEQSRALAESAVLSFRARALEESASRQGLASLRLLQTVRANRHWSRVESTLATAGADLANPTRPEPDPLATWKRSSEFLSHFAAGRGLAYLHVLQPNQYFGSKPMGESERKRAVDPRSPYRDAVERWYPEFRAAPPLLAQDRAQFLDATALFDGEQSATYSDRCCHYTLLGNELLAQAVGKELRVLVSSRGSSTEGTPSPSVPGSSSRPGS